MSSYYASNGKLAALAYASGGAMAALPYATRSGVDLAGVFTPRSISGCACWLRADLGITIATNVSAWADQSGSGDTNKNVNQGNPALQPIFNANDVSYNNKPTISFVSASSKYMASGTWAASVAQSYSAFVVGNGDGAAANEYFTDGIVLDSGDIFATLASTSKPGMYAGAILSGGVTSSSPMIVGADFNGASSAVYQSALTAVATGNAGTANRTGLILGCAANISGGFLNGKIAEVVIYNRLLTSPERTQLMSYFGSRYAISIGP